MNIRKRGKMKTKKITIIALHLSYGGVEKAILELANYLSENYDVEIISTYKINELPAFSVSNKIKIKYLLKDKPNKKEFQEALKGLKLIKIIKEGLKSINILYKRRSTLIKELKIIKTDVIISTRAFHNKMVGKYINDDILKIAWEHNHHQNNKKYIRKVINSVKYFDYFVVVSKELQRFYEKKVIPKCIYIPNSIKIEKNFAHNPQKKLIAVGRLEPEKGFLDLIDIFKVFNDIYPDFKLIIVGDGSQKKILEERIVKYKIEKKIKIMGFLSPKNVHKELNTAMLYLMTSYTESFGIVLIEAMAHSIPCLAFDSANGAKEIIKNNYNGYLIKNRNQKQYIEALIELIENEELYNYYSLNANKTSNLFSSDKINKKWIKLVESKMPVCYNRKKEDDQFD